MNPSRPVQDAIECSKVEGIFRVRGDIGVFIGRWGNCAIIDESLYCGEEEIIPFTDIQANHVI